MKEKLTDFASTCLPLVGTDAQVLSQSEIDYVVENGHFKDFKRVSERLKRLGIFTEFNKLKQGKVTYVEHDNLRIQSKVLGDRRKDQRPFFQLGLQVLEHHIQHNKVLNRPMSRRQWLVESGLIIPWWSSYNGRDINNQLIVDRLKEMYTFNPFVERELSKIVKVVERTVSSNISAWFDSLMKTLGQLGYQFERVPFAIIKNGQQVSFNKLNEDERLTWIEKNTSLVKRYGSSWRSNHDAMVAFHDYLNLRGLVNIVDFFQVVRMSDRQPNRIPESYKEKATSNFWDKTSKLLTKPQKHIELISDQPLTLVISSELASTLAMLPNESAKAVINSASEQLCLPIHKFASYKLQGTVRSKDGQYEIDLDSEFNSDGSKCSFFAYVQGGGENNVLSWLTAIGELEEIVLVIARYLCHEDIKKSPSW